MRVRGAFHTGFTVSNLERSVTFYRDVLGLEVIAQQVVDADYLSKVVGFANVCIKMAFVKTPGNDDHVLELLEYTSHPAEPTDRATNRPGNGHLCFYVDDIWSSYRELTEKGVPFVHEPALITEGVNRGAIATYFRDPDGFSLELFQRPLAK